MIDPNKQYRTRDGRPVRIYATDTRGCYPVHGAVLNVQNGVWHMVEWNSEGVSSTAFTIGSNEQSRLDLIEGNLADELTKQIPWEALRPEIKWVGMDGNGFWYGYKSPPVPSPTSFHWSPAIGNTRWQMTSINTPEVYLGSWRETLCKRPEGR